MYDANSFIHPKNVMHTKKGLSFIMKDWIDRSSIRFLFYMTRIYIVGKKPQLPRIILDVYESLHATLVSYQSLYVKKKSTFNVNDKKLSAY